MTAPRVSEDEFIEVWMRLRSPSKVSRFLKQEISGVYSRRKRIEEKRGILLPVDDERVVSGPKSKARAGLKALGEQRHTHLEYECDDQVQDGTVIVFNDAHYWPGVVTTAHRALLALAARISPEMIVANGDILDGASISRHPRQGWESRPKVAEEIDVLCTRMKEIEKAAPGARLLRTVGNHDQRFESFIAAHAPELEGVHGTSLMDFLPHWRACYSLHVNRGQDGWTVIRHVHVAGGIHSAYNSTVRAGTHYVHGHLHKLVVTPFGDYRGRRYGVDAGTLAEPGGPQFTYTQGAPLNWCSGFVVLTYRGGRLMPPEVCEVSDGVAYFRGEAVCT